MQSQEARQEQALRWIANLLHNAGIPFQVAGGLAARAHGATRPLVDLDFYVPTDRLAVVAALAPEHVVWGPAHVREAGWDITFMKLEYAGQRIELGGADTVYIFDRHARQWVAAPVDFSTSEEHEILGVVVPVMPLEQLIAYKRVLDRDLDRLDLAELETR